MILKASQRGGAQQLALHLLNPENEHVTVHELRGFVSEDVTEAFQEMYAISKATQCKKFMFSLSLNPPPQERVGIETFENAIERIEKTLQIEGQPRCIILHEKEGRRHAHCVWSRIDGQQVKAIKLDYYKQKLNGIAKELYLEHGWTMPDGFTDPALRDPRNFTLAEWQQAKRSHIDPRELKSRLHQCWQRSDDKRSFESALSESGLFLARGDRRGYVAVDWKAEVYSLSRLTGAKSKDLQARLGAASALPSVSDIKVKIQQETGAVHLRLERELELKHKLAMQPLQTKRRAILTDHRSQRQSLKQQQEARWQHEQMQRQRTLRKGLGGLWDYLTGKSRQQKQRNEQEAHACQQRDRQERETLVLDQLAHRQILQTQLQALRQVQQSERIALRAEFVSGAEKIMPDQAHDPEREKPRTPAPENAPSPSPRFNPGM